MSYMSIPIAPLKSTWTGHLGDDLGTKAHSIAKKNLKRRQDPVSSPEASPAANGSMIDPSSDLIDQALNSLGNGSPVIPGLKNLAVSALENAGVPTTSALTIVTACGIAFYVIFIEPSSQRNKLNPNTAIWEQSLVLIALVGIITLSLYPIIGAPLVKRLNTNSQQAVIDVKNKIEATHFSNALLNVLDYFAHTGKASTLKKFLTAALDYLHTHPDVLGKIPTVGTTLSAILAKIESVIRIGAKGAAVIAAGLKLGSAAAGVPLPLVRDLSTSSKTVVDDKTSSSSSSSLSSSPIPSSDVNHDFETAIEHEITDDDTPLTPTLALASSTDDEITHLFNYVTRTSLSTIHSALKNICPSINLQPDSVNTLYHDTPEQKFHFHRQHFTHFIDGILKNLHTKFAHKT